MAKKNWIKKAVKHPGALTDTAKKAGAVHNGKIDEGWLKARAKQSDQTGARARLALAFRKMGH